MKPLVIVVNCTRWRQLLIWHNYLQPHQIFQSRKWNGKTGVELKARAAGLRRARFPLRVLITVSLQPQLTWSLLVCFFCCFLSTPQKFTETRFAGLHTPQSSTCIPVKCRRKCSVIEGVLSRGGFVVWVLSDILRKQSGPLSFCHHFVTDFQNSLTGKLSSNKIMSEMRVKMCLSCTRERRGGNVFGPGRRVPKIRSSCSCCCYQFTKNP